MTKYFLISWMLSSIIACSSTQELHPTTPEVAASPLKTESAVSQSTEKNEAPAVHEGNKHVSQDKKEQAHEHHREAGPVPSDKALGWLKNGNHRFMKGSLRHDGATKKDRMRLATGQKPHSIVLSCSDSRVPPEVVFDQKLGEIFVVRTAGEALDNNVVASIEYAVEHLGANLLVVMGHESCGAVKASLSALGGADLGTPALNALAQDLKPRLQEFSSKPPSKGFIEESWGNVEGVAKDLLDRSALLREAVALGHIKITKAMYHLDSGQVEWR